MTQPDKMESKLPLHSSSDALAGRASTPEAELSQGLRQHLSVIFGYAEIIEGALEPDVAESIAPHLGAIKNAALGATAKLDRFDAVKRQQLLEPSAVHTEPSLSPPPS